MADERTPRDDGRPGADVPGRRHGIARVVELVVTVLGAVVRGTGAASGGGPGVVDPHAGHRTDEAARRRRDHRP